MFIERLWRSLTYECVYLHAFETGSKLRAGLAYWIGYYYRLVLHRERHFRDVVTAIGDGLMRHQVPRKKSGRAAYHASGPPECTKAKRTMPSKAQLQKSGNTS